MTESIQDPRLAAASAALNSSDPSKDFAMYETLAQTGSRAAMMVLANIFATGRMPTVEKDFDKALYWLQRAYTTGSRSAAIDLCKIYTRGRDAHGIAPVAKKSIPIYPNV